FRANAARRGRRICPNKARPRATALGRSILNREKIQRSCVGLRHFDPTHGAFPRFLRGRRSGGSNFDRLQFVDRAPTLLLRDGNWRAIAPAKNSSKDFGAIAGPPAV